VIITLVCVGLLEVKEGEAVSNLHAIKTDPSKPSAAAMQTADMFDKLLTRTHTRAEHEPNDQMRSQRQTIKAALAALRSLGAIILDDAVAASALRPQLFAALPRDALEAQVAGLDEWVTGTKSDAFHGLVRRFSHLRQFSPVLLRALEFFPDAGDGDVPCLEALRVLKEMNAWPSCWPTAATSACTP